jgi:hypothetical protein
MNKEPYYIGIDLASGMSEQVAEYKEQMIIHNICSQFSVARVVKERQELSKGRKAELFLLGAVFSSNEIEGWTCDTMIYDSTLYILGVNHG